MIKGNIHSIETFAALDGPGIRTAVFMQGCILRCRYCHNPDTFVRGGGTECTAAELFDKVIRYREYYGQNGGVTVSGGEPLLQAEFLAEFFKLLKAAGINTALDTAGSVFNDSVKQLLEYTDLIILDIKHTDGKEYDSLCGLPEGSGLYNKVLDFLEYCSAARKRLWLRQVIVPGINDTRDQVTALKTLIDKYKPEKAELLAYHTMGAAKWERLGLDYTLKDTAPPDDKKMKELNRILNPRR